MILTLSQVLDQLLEMICTVTYMDSIIFFVKTSSNSLFKPVFMVSERTRLGRWLTFLSLSTSSSSSIILNNEVKTEKGKKLVKVLYVLAVNNQNLKFEE